MGEMDNSHSRYYAYADKQLADQYARYCPKEFYISPEYRVSLPKWIAIDPLDGK